VRQPAVLVLDRHQFTQRGLPQIGGDATVEGDDLTGRAVGAQQIGGGVQRGVLDREDEQVLRVGQGQQLVPVGRIAAQRVGRVVPVRVRDQGVGRRR
jgi:hypothetical protein